MRWNRFVSAVMLGLVMAQVAIVPDARAQTAPAPAYAVKPLMIIRFNQPEVRYGRQLVSAVARVQHVKPDAVFTLVVFAASYGDEATQAQLAERAEMQLQQVRSQLIGLQVPDKNIEIVRMRNTQITHAEVHILVR